MAALWWPDDEEGEDGEGGGSGGGCAEEPRWTLADSAVAAFGGRGGRPSAERGEAAGGVAGRGTSSSSEPVTEEGEIRDKAVRYLSFFEYEL